MKILITTDLYPPSVNGVVTSVLSLAHGLEARGHEVRILTLSDTVHTRTEGNVTRLGSLGLGWIYPGIRIRGGCPAGVLRELVAWSPDVVHSQCEFSTFRMAWAVARRCHVPLIHTCHTVYEDYTHYFSPCVRVGRGLAARFMRRIAGKTDAVIAPTEKVRQLLLSYGVKAPIAVIPTGTEEQESAQPAPGQLAELRRTLGIAEGKRVLLYLGRLAKEKNLPALLRLAEHPKLRDAVLVFVGDGPYRAELERQACAPELRDRVRFVGAVPHSEVERYYRLGDVFVNASESETQGLTYAETMAAGIPVVCKTDPCVSGLLESGRNGFACADEDEMADAIERLFNDGNLRREIVGAARETVGRGYTSEVFAAAVEALYLLTAERLAKETVSDCVEADGKG